MINAIDVNNHADLDSLYNTRRIALMDLLGPSFIQLLDDGFSYSEVEAITKDAVRLLLNRLNVIM